MKKILNLKITDTRIKLLLEDQDFYVYLKSIMKDYIADPCKNINVVSSFKWQDEFIRKNPLKIIGDLGYENLGPNIALSKDNANLKFLKKIHQRRFKIGFNLDQGKISQELFCHRKILKALAERINKKPKYLDFFEISYYLLYYPLFWFLENFKGIYPMHASCVATPKGGIIMAGLPGSGKTVTSLSLWNYSDRNNMVSDNIVLYDTKRVYGCPEPIRLYEHGRNMVEEDRLICMDPVGKKSSKGFYNPVNSTDSCIPKVFLIISLGTEYSLKQMDPVHASGMALNQSIQGAEILSYFEYAGLLNFLNSEKNLFKDRIDVLIALFKNLKCFSLTIPKKQPVDFTVEKILSLV